MNELKPYGGIDTSQFRGHPVDLEVFSGPLDLLLHLIQQDQIEIWEISISRITRQYLEHLQRLEALNVEIAGEFLVMAATLMRIKSQMLLPRPAAPEEDGDGMPLTREGLIQRLLEYRRYRDAAQVLRDMEDERRRSLPRGWAPLLEKSHLYPLREARAVDLATYLREVLERPAPIDTHEVQLEEIRLEEKIEQLLAAIASRGDPIPFREMIARPWWRLEWIVTFLALLELMRQGKAIALQEESFGDLWVLAAPPSEQGLEGHDLDGERMTEPMSMEGMP
ncbi:MAG: segregation/condensation protein A [Candidatus Eisenbacteria bacterium]|nr:segregation/condensation protein A [Candidatus Eisenbacteria bacterium]